MSNLIRRISTGLPRSLAGRIGFIVLLALVLISTAALQLALPCKSGGTDITEASSFGDTGKMLVVMVFAGNQMQKTITALERWETVVPCSLDTTKSQAHLMLYTDSELGEAEAGLKSTINGLASIRECFEKVSYASASLKGVDNTYNKKRENHLWVRGPNQLFYTMMLKIMPREEWASTGVRHLFWMEPDNIPQHSGWLEHLLSRGHAGPYWIQGTTYSGDCIPQEGGRCDLIGRAIRAHINGNALYHVGDPAFLAFVEQVSEGEWKHWPFDLAMQREVQESWPEPKFRQKAHLLQIVDWIRNYGPYPYKPEDLPRHVIFVHADPKPAIAERFTGNYTESEADVADKATLQAAQEATSLRERLKQVQDELEKLRGASTGQEKTGGDALAGRLGNEETRRMLLPTPITEKLPAQLELRSPSLAAAATSDGQLLMVVLSAQGMPMLENYVRLAENAGAAKHLVLVPIDAIAGQAASAFADRVGVIVPSNGTAVDRARLGAVLSVLRQGFSVVTGDVDDVAWLREPFKSSSEYDLELALNARQGRREVVGDQECDPFVSAGLGYWKPTSAVIDLLETLLKAPPSDTDLDVLLSDALKSAGSSLKWRTLEPTLYPNGPLFFEERLPQESGAHPVAVLNTWVAPASKPYRLREAGLWAPSKAVPGMKYLTYFDVVEDNGLNNQRQALRNALAVARVLNRTLILPTFHRQHRLASPVPMDYFFDSERFFAEFLQVQPHHFLEEAFPEWQKLPVQVMDVAIPPVPSDAPWLDRAVIVKPEREWHGASVAELRGWYAAKEDPLLVFFGFFRRFDKFDDPEDHARFNQQIHRALAPMATTLSLAKHVSGAVEAASPSGRYDCFHLRHSAEFLDGQRAWGIVKPLEEIVQLLKAKMPPSKSTLYLTTDVPTNETRAAFLAAGYPSVAFLYDYFPQKDVAHVTTLEGETTMREGQVDQLVCSQAESFIGNEYSTFTWHIAFLRQQAGFAQISEDIYDRSRQGMEFL